MQPYFFPYIGYFQLISSSDLFVLHDDVQYIKGGWVNRNRILMKGEVRMITLPVQKGPHDLPINERRYVADLQVRKQILNIIKQAYAKAPCYPQVFPMVEELLMYDEANVAYFNENLIRRIVSYLGLQCRIITSSSMDKNNDLAGEMRVVDICGRLGATDYTNPEGGQALYHANTFRTAGIELRFLCMRPRPYLQQSPEFVPYLSIIDGLMQLGPHGIKPYLIEFDLIPGTSGQGTV